MRGLSSKFHSNVSEPITFIVELRTGLWSSLTSLCPTVPNTAPSLSSPPPPCPCVTSVTPPSRRTGSSVHALGAGRAYIVIVSRSEQTPETNPVQVVMTWNSSVKKWASLESGSETRLRKFYYFEFQFFSREGYFTFAIRPSVCFSVCMSVRNQNSLTA